jgi:hypothetical protein
MGFSCVGGQKKKAQQLAALLGLIKLTAGLD